MFGGNFRLIMVLFCKNSAGLHPLVHKLRRIKKNIYLYMYSCGLIIRAGAKSLIYNSPTLRLNSIFLYASFPSILDQHLLFLNLRHLCLFFFLFLFCWFFCDIHVQNKRPDRFPICFNPFYLIYIRRLFNSGWGQRLQIYRTNLFLIDHGWLLKDHNSLHRLTNGDYIDT